MFLLLFLTVIIMVSGPHWTIMWASFELNTLFFLSMNKKVYSFPSGEFDMKYFCMQFIGSIFFIISFMIGSDLLFFISLNIKLLMLPFFFWLFNNLKWMSKKFFTIFITIQKMGPLFLLWGNSFSSTMMFTYLIINIVIPPFWGVIKKSVKDVLLISSVMYTSLMEMIIFHKTLFILFMMSYYLVIFLFLLSPLSTTNFFIPLILYCLLSGFPLFIMFSAKIYVFSAMSFYLNTCFLMIIMFFMGTTFFMYMNAIFFTYYINSYSKIPLLKHEMLKINKKWTMTLFVQILGFYWI